MLEGHSAPPYLPDSPSGTVPVDAECRAAALGLGPSGVSRVSAGVTGSAPRVGVVRLVTLARLGPLAGPARADVGNAVAPSAPNELARRQSLTRRTVPGLGLRLAESLVSVSSVGLHGRRHSA